MIRTVFLTLTGAFVALILFPAALSAQTVLPLGTVQAALDPFPCPQGVDSHASCFKGTVTCPSTNNIDFSYVYTPAQASPFKGTIVFFNGKDGTDVGFQEYVTDYTQAGYETVQVVWATAWETAGTGTGTTPTYIKTSACRPATLLNFFFHKFEQNRTPTRQAMCAHGTSAGSAAIAYSLTQYGAGGYLDHVELTSGPVMSQIDTGCVFPHAQPITVCGDGFCKSGTEGTWMDSPTYVGGAESQIDKWTEIPGSQACAHTNSFPQQWREMSIVDRLQQNQDATFSYPHTGMTGWLCSGPHDAHCPNGNPNTNQNNSAAQGYLYYPNVISPRLTVYRVDNCSGTEGVKDGNVPELACANGKTKISADMITNCRLHH